MTAVAIKTPRAQRGQKYLPPERVLETSFSQALSLRKSLGAEARQATFDIFGKQKDRGDFSFWYSGELDLLKSPCVAIVGTREVSPAGKARARRLARELCGAGVVIVSGLAYGVDTEAHTAAIESGGRTIAVIGTPIDRCSPAENSRLQETIYRDHLLISQFARGSNVFPGNFPVRNRLMAALCDATVIIEASDTSGTLHQAAECARLKRQLGILKAVAEDASLKWPADFMKYPTTFVVNDTKDVLHRIGL